jgi:hypothetical protein
LQPWPDHARLPRLSPPPLIFHAAGCALHITSSLLCPQAAKQEYDQVILKQEYDQVILKQEYDQVILMFTGPSFSKTIFSNAELQNVLSSCANESTVLPQPENFQIE